MNKKIALITGITGQDGAYLTKFLLDKDYIVHGIARRASLPNMNRIDELVKGHENEANLHMHYGDLADSSCMTRLVTEIKPDEIYNLAAQSHVKISFDVPEFSADVNAIGTLRLLEAIRIAGLTGKTKFYQASTSELYGLVQEVPQTETTPFYPRSPYGVAKLFAYWIVKNYRESYDMFACNGILFNHESPYRGEEFVTRKITRALARIKCGLQSHLELGNMDALRDWGHSRDYVKMQWMMLQQEEPVDYVIATGEQHSVKEFVDISADMLGIKLKWEGSGLDQVAINTETGETVVKVNPDFFRPAEVETLLGDPTKAKDELGWTPDTSFEELVREMAQYDLNLAQKELAAAQK